MYSQFIHGVPENLEVILRNFNPNENTNLTIDDLRYSIIGYVRDSPKSFKSGRIVNNSGDTIKPAGEESSISSI